MNSLSSVLGALGALSFIGTLIAAIAQRRKVAAEAGKTGADAAAVATESAIDAAVVLMRELRVELAAARQEGDALRRELAGARAELDALRGHLRHVEEMVRERGVDVPPFHWPYSHHLGDKP